MSERTIQWLMGGAGAGAVIFGGFLLSAVHDVSGQVDKLSIKMQEMVPRDTHIMVWTEDREKFAHIESEIDILRATKADSASIVHDQEALRQEIRELNRRLGYEEDGSTPRKRTR